MKTVKKVKSSDMRDIMIWEREKQHLRLELVNLRLELHLVSSILLTSTLEASSIERSLTSLIDRIEFLPTHLVDKDSFLINGGQNFGKKHMRKSRRQQSLTTKNRQGLDLNTCHLDWN